MNASRTRTTGRLEAETRERRRRRPLGGWATLVLLVGLGVAACAAAGWWAARRSCAVCVEHTNLSLHARGFGAPRFCGALQEDPDVVPCQVAVDSDPVLCTQKRRSVEIEVRDRGLFGQGLLGSILCQELRSRPIEEVLAEH